MPCSLPPMAHFHLVLPPCTACLYRSQATNYPMDMAYGRDTVYVDVVSGA